MPTAESGTPPSARATTPPAWGFSISTLFVLTAQAATLLACIDFARFQPLAARILEGNGSTNENATLAIFATICCLGGAHFGITGCRSLKMAVVMTAAGFALAFAALAIVLAPAPLVRSLVAAFSLVAVALIASSRSSRLPTASPP